VQGEIDAALVGFHDALARIEGLFGVDGRGPGWYFHWFELRCALMAERQDLARQALASIRRTAPSSMNGTTAAKRSAHASWKCWHCLPPATATRSSRGSWA